MCVDRLLHLGARACRRLVGHLQPAWRQDRSAVQVWGTAFDAPRVRGPSREATGAPRLPRPTRRPARPHARAVGGAPPWARSSGTADCSHSDGRRPRSPGPPSSAERTSASGQKASNSRRVFAPRSGRAAPPPAPSAATKVSSNFGALPTFGSDRIDAIRAPGISSVMYLRPSGKDTPSSLLFTRHRPTSQSGSSSSEASGGGCTAQAQSVDDAWPKELMVSPLPRIWRAIVDGAVEACAGAA